MAAWVRMKNDGGFTLAEVMVAILIGVFLLLGIYTAVNMAQRSSSGMERKIGAQQDVKTALDLMELEIRMASYNPNFVAGIWINPATCASATATDQNYKGIQAATANSLTIEMDINGSSAVGDWPNEIIAYTYNTANLYISRDTIQVNACSQNQQAILGGTVTGQKTVRVVNNSSGIPVFQYYDGTGAQIPEAMLPASIPDIRRIDITLAVETENIDPSTNQRRGMIYSTSVILRNHI